MNILDGTLVAIKVVCPTARRDTLRDILILRRAVRWISRIESLRRMPVVKAFHQIQRLIVLQFDLTREARVQDHLAEAIASHGVRTAKVLWPVSKRVLVMEWLAELSPLTALADARERRSAAIQALHSLYEMIFVQGWVHCDLHPGNLYRAPDASIVILDFGLSAKLKDDTRRALARFFLAMIANDAPSAVEVIVETALELEPAVRIEKLHRDIDRLLNDSHSKSVGDFDLVRFVSELFDCQASNGITATPEFALPIAALAMLEDRLKQLCPSLSFQREAGTFVVHALSIPVEAIS